MKLCHSSSGQQWKIRRRILTPSFHDNRLLENAIDTFNNQLIVCLQNLQNIADEGIEKNLSKCISAWTLDVICGNCHNERNQIPDGPKITGQCLIANNF